MNARRRLLPVLLAPLALMGCGDDDDTARADTAATSTSASTPVDDATPRDTTGSPAATDTGSASEPAPEREPASSDTDITIERSRFSMDEIRVAAGSTVVWENLDGYAHTVTSTDDAPTAFDSSGLAEGDRFEFTFDEPGTYSYFCQIHPTMRAVVIVE